MAKKLLLADDSVTVQRVVELTFADEGVDVISVSDGTAAIARLSQEVPDIVLVDVEMPGADGYQVAEHIKSTPALSHVPVVLMTGAFAPLDEKRARQVKCDAVLAKPFEPHMVIALVNELLIGGGTRSPLPADPARDAAVGHPEGTRSLDDYLERLDDALTAATAPLSLRTLDSIAAVTSIAVTTPATAGPARRPAADPEPVVAPAPDAAPDLAQAFSDLLSEELGEARLPAATWNTLAEQTEAVPAAASPGRAATPALSDAVIEDIADRVAKRLTSRAMQEAVNQRVIEVAERLVREEIERIKATAH